MNCEYCSNPLDLYLNEDPVASNAARHSFLFQCPRCCALYEVTPEERILPKRLTEQQAAERFPEAVTVK